MTRILRYSLIAATVTILLAQGGTALADAVEPVSVFLVRHAEKAADDPQDPQLSVNGKQRASELARILSNAGVTHLFSSQFRRTKSTLQPLAEKTGGEIVIIRAQPSADQVEALRDLPPGSGIPGQGSAARSRG